MLFRSANGSASITGTAQTGAALTPALSTTTPTSDGFSFTISNYDSNYTWSITGATNSIAASGASATISVTGLNPGASATITVATSRTGYANGSAQVTGTAQTGAALTPSYGAVTRTADGFTSTISNYSALYTFTGTTTAGKIGRAHV